MKFWSSLVSSGLFFLLHYFLLEFCFAVDIITSSKFLKDNEQIISGGSTFKLGFFSPANSSHRYVGIWYNHIPVKTVIWVANRNKPLEDSSGVLRISQDGNLVVLNGKNETLWSSSISYPVTNSSAQLLDTGNLILKDQSNGINIWESFQHPSDTFLANMKLVSDARTGEIVQLTSWKSPSDPSVGRYSLGINSLHVPEVFLWNDNKPRWRSGPWDGQIFLGVNMKSVYLNGFNFGSDGETFQLTYVNANQSNVHNYVLNSEGSIVLIQWEEGMDDCMVKWTTPETDCDVYGKCGAFASCNAQKSPICSCLKGFVPKNKVEWDKGNWTNGCIRKKPLQCERIDSGNEADKQDKFLKLEMVKPPESAEWSTALLEDKCKDDCLNNCSCMAYSYYKSIGCMYWTKDLVDIHKFSSDTGVDLYIRVAYSELDKKKGYVKTVIVIAVVISLIFIAFCVFFSWRLIAKYRARNRKTEEISLFSTRETHVAGDTLLGDNVNNVKFQELPLFSLKKLAAATNNFSLSNKLGQGGFGPVYKGTLQDGQEIAVKRLSQTSGQGLEEFKNEVVVISKLQHRNLVRLLGCCVEEEEKILVYEYMPNNSLDAFILDPMKNERLTWRNRFIIIEGICRGLLYLHRDSRLRIIHRDLKASNILLDKELNPKISDFGMARIFGGTEDQANTRRVVGTYGYMSPEYAMEGLFSEKSDVFSFGVLLLEIVSGRKNTSFYEDEESLTLLGHAWKLWNEDNIVALIDPGIYDPEFQTEILRSIHVGLLCVQEYAKDRPTMSGVISMLKSEIVDLPEPKRPAFTARQTLLSTKAAQESLKPCSINNVTVSVVQGR